VRAQENCLLAGGKELLGVTASPVLLHVMVSVCVLLDGIRLQAALYLQAVLLCSLAVQEAGGLLRGGGLAGFMADVALCLLITGAPGCAPCPHAACPLAAACGARTASQRSG